MDKVSTFWWGEKLGPLEYLTLKSYLDHGYEVDLYVFDEVKNVPAGVRLKGAAMIAASPRQWGAGDVRIYSDYWRFCFLADVGGTWIDTDCPVVRKLDFIETSEFYFGKETQQWRGGLFGGLIHSKNPGHPAMVGLKKFYEDPGGNGTTVEERRAKIGWYAFCHEFYRFGSTLEQSGEPGRFTPLALPEALDGKTLSTEGRYDGSVRLSDYKHSYTLHLIGCYFGHWGRGAVRGESLVGDLIRRHIGDVDVNDFLFRDRGDPD